MGTIGMPILATPALVIVCKLIGRRLPNIDAGAACEMFSGDLGHLARTDPAACCRSSRFFEAQPSSPAFESDRREVKSASISARSNCKNASENVGDSRIVNRTDDSSSIHAGRNANEPSEKRETAERCSVVSWSDTRWQTQTSMSDRHASYLHAVLIDHHDRMAAPLMVIFG
jgi:hypothetical protein